MSLSMVTMAISALIAASSPALAATAPPVSLGSAFLQTVWALLVVIGIILVLYALSRKRFGVGRRGSGRINLVELRHIMPKTTLALVEVEGKRLLLGIGSGRINLLADLSKQKTNRFPDTDNPDFAALLQQEKEQ